MAKHLFIKIVHKGYCSSKSNSSNSEKSLILEKYNFT